MGVVTIKEEGGGGRCALPLDPPLPNSLLILLERESLLGVSLIKNVQFKVQ